MLEIFQDIFHFDSNFRVWFDRDVSFQLGRELGTRYGLTSALSYFAL